MARQAKEQVEMTNVIRVPNLPRRGKSEQWKLLAAELAYLVNEGLEVDDAIKLMNDSGRTKPDGTPIERKYAYTRLYQWKFRLGKELRDGIRYAKTGRVFFQRKIRRGGSRRPRIESSRFRVDINLFALLAFFGTVALIWRIL